MTNDQSPIILSMKTLYPLFLFLLLSLHVGSTVTSTSKTHNSKSFSLYNTLHLSDAGLTEDVFALALKGFSKLSQNHLLNTDSILTIIDYSQSSKEKRLYVIDLKNQELDFTSVVSHGRNSGYEFANSFSNAFSSNKSSLGFYITRDTYYGANGYSLKLEGEDRGFNDKAMQRAIVMHGAPYANEAIIYQKGYLGRSLGCPALPIGMHKKIIDKIKNGNALFVYYPQQNYLLKSEWLRN